MVKAKSKRKVILGQKKSIKSKSAKLKADNSKGSISKTVEEYKKELMEIDKTQDKYDKLFEQKLSQQYKEFRNMKEHHIQTKKFFRVFIILMVIILITLLLVSFR